MLTSNNGTGQQQQHNLFFYSILLDQQSQTATFIHRSVEPETALTVAVRACLCVCVRRKVVCVGWEGVVCVCAWEGGGRVCVWVGCSLCVKEHHWLPRFTCHSSSSQLRPQNRFFSFLFFFFLFFPFPGSQGSQPYPIVSGSRRVPLISLKRVVERKY